MSRREREVAWQAMRLRNFRAFKDTGWIRFAPLTLLFGRNSSGKTTLLRAPLFLRTIATLQTATGEVPLASPEFDFGSYKDLVYEGELRRDISLEFDLATQPVFRYHTSMVDYLGPFRSFAEELRCGIDLHWNAPYARTQVEQIRFSFVESGKPAIIFSRRGPSAIDVDVPGLRQSLKLDGVPELSFRNLRYLSLEWNGERVAHGTDLDFVISVATDALLNVASSVIHIGPLRDMPERAYRLEQAVSPRGTSLGTLGVMRRERGVARAVSQALKTIGIATEVEVTGPAPGYFGIVITEPESGRKMNLSDVGFGVSQVLPILVTLATAARGSLVLIQQPELHLHPDAQGGLADALVDIARERGITLVVESHSEHILLRLQRRIASGSLTPADVSVYITDRGKVIKASIDEIGRLDPRSLPKGFFEEEWSDAVQLAREAAKRAPRE